MTQAERDVIDAAIAAVYVKTERNLMVADIVQDTHKVGALVRAVVILNRERAGGGYWRER